MVLGIALFIPGYVLYTNGPSEINFAFSLNLCQDPDNVQKWYISTPAETCAQNTPLSFTSQVIALEKGLFNPHHKYSTKIWLSNHFTGEISYYLSINSVPFVTSEIFTINKQSRPENKLNPQSPFDLCGGDSFQIWRDMSDTSYLSIPGFFSNGTDTCGHQLHQGCTYEPMRSMIAYNVMENIFLFELPSVDANARVDLVVTHALVTDSTNSLPLAPDLWIQFVPHDSSSQSFGFWLLFFGALLFDVSPGIAYFISTYYISPLKFA